MIPHLDLWREQCQKLVLVKRNNLDTSFHFHSPIELCLVKKGELEVFINDQHAILHEGELAVALSYDFHCHRSISETTEALIMIIPPHLCPEFAATVKKQHATTPFIRDLAVTDKITGYCEALQACAQNAVKSMGFMNVILGTVMESIPFETVSMEAASNLSARIILYIEQNFQKELTLPSIAKALGYNSSYLSRYFNAHFHIGISRYVTLIRLKHFMKLSKCGTKSTADYAYESGFRSLRTFYRAFYNEFHCTPKDFIS